MSSVPDGFAESGVQAFYRVGRIHEFAKLGRELEERHELCPGSFPGLDHRRIFGSPLGCELGEVLLGNLDRRCRVDLTHRPGDRLPIFLRGIRQRVAHHVHDTQLHRRLWIDCFNGFRETFQAINTSDEDVGFLQKLLSSTKKVKIFYVIN